MNDQPGWFVWLQIIVMFVLAWTGWIAAFVVILLYAVMLAMAIALVYGSVVIWFPPRRKL